MSTPEDIQNEEIGRLLQETQLCEIDRSVDDMVSVSTPLVRRIMNEEYSNGVEMKAVQCLLETLFRLSTGQKRNGIYSIGPQIKKWFATVKRTGNKGMQGYIILGEFLDKDIPVIIKLPLNSGSFENDLIREYFVGIMGVNNLRYILPTFVYTLGAFRCSAPPEVNDESSSEDSSMLREEITLCEDAGEGDSVYVIYENIPGKTLIDMLSDEEINFTQFVRILAQVALSLEVAQRHIRFTHYDLHPGNIMIREDEEKGFAYNVCLDESTYQITDTQMPVIIDLGNATIYKKEKYWGEYGYDNNGMMTFMIPGVDIYKLLIFCVRYAKGTMKAKVREIFDTLPPPEIYKVQTARGINAAVDTFGRRVTYSHLAQITPGMFLESLIEKYPEELEEVFTKRERKELIPLDFNNSTILYDKLIQKPSLDAESSESLIDKCNRMLPSYVMSLYNIMIMRGYYEMYGQEKIKAQIDLMEMMLEKYKPKLQERDYILFEKFHDIKIPNVEELEHSMKSLMDIKLNQKNRYDYDEVEFVREMFFENSEFFRRMQPYFQFIYTLKEVGLEEEYTNVLTDFYGSPQYILYNRLLVRFRQAERWSQTLEGAINSDQ